MKSLTHKTNKTQNEKLNQKLTDRWSQKELLWDYDIPTSPFMKINSKDDLDFAFKVYDGQLTLKKRISQRIDQHIGHLDGLSVHIIKSALQLKKFKLKHKGLENHFLAEELIHFKSEITFVFMRDLNNRTQVLSTSNHSKEKSLVLKIKNMLHEMNYVGLIIFDVFNTGPDLIVDKVKLFNNLTNEKNKTGVKIKSDKN